MIHPTTHTAKRLALPDKTPSRPSVNSRPEPSRSPTLRLSPTAWAKLLFLRDVGETEVGGFGISAADDPLYVGDIQLVRQTCDVASVAFDDASVADFFDRQVDAGLTVSQVGRIWVHSHPGSCPQPSTTDEATFARVFGRTDWALMFIVARDGKTYARLQFNVGPGGSLMLPMEVDYRRPFKGSDHAAWNAEYQANVEVWEWTPGGFEDPLATLDGAGVRATPTRSDVFDFWDDFPLDDRPISAEMRTERVSHD